MSNPAHSSSSSQRGARHRNHGTQRTATQTCYKTRGTLKGTQRERESFAKESEWENCDTSGEQQPLPLSQEDLSKIAELIIRQLLTNSNVAQTTAPVLVPFTLSPAATVVQLSLTMPLAVTRTSTPIMAVTEACTQVIASAGALVQPLLTVPCKLLY